MRSVVGLEFFGNECVPSSDGSGRGGSIGRGGGGGGAEEVGVLSAEEGDGGVWTTDLALGCGLSLQGKPGLLEVTLTSGARARNGYASIVVKRSWVTVGESGASSSSVFTEVDVVDDTTGEQ